VAVKLYSEDIRTFQALVKEVGSSAELLDRIRAEGGFDKEIRGSLLKLFRRCVSLILDTETTSKIKKFPTAALVESYGHTFKEIEQLKSEFAELPSGTISALAALLAENDSRGQSGYLLTEQFFSWFEKTYKGRFSIDGPRGAGKDIELKTLFPDFDSSYPCDFVIKGSDTKLLAVGFARYDSTRGGSQSDDRTGGNSNKVEKAKAFHATTGNKFRIVFLADGPGLTHGDTWEEASLLDGAWDDNVRVTTLKLAPTRITADWLES